MRPLWTVRDRLVTVPGTEQTLGPTGAGTFGPVVRVPRVQARRRGCSNGDCERSRAGRLVERGPRGGARPRGPARHLPQHADHARDRGARSHPLQAGQDPGLFLHGSRQRGELRRSRDRDGRGRRRHAAPPRHGRPHHPRCRALADLRAVHGQGRRAHEGQGRQRPHGRLQPRVARDGQPPAGDAPGRRGLRARVSHPRGAACRGRVVRRRRIRAGRRARGDEPCRGSAAPCRLHLRQQPVGVLDADSPRVRVRDARRPRPGVRLRGRGRRRHRRPRRLPRGQARDREGARGRRPDSDRVDDAPHGGPCRPRRRVLRPEGALRGVGATRPDRALPVLAPRQRGPQRLRGGRDRSGRQAPPHRSDPARRRVVAARPVHTRRRRLRHARGTRHTASQVMAEKTYLQAISDGLRQEMRRDKRVFVIGEDVGVYGGAFKVTLGFQEEFGPWRVIDAPLSETAIVAGCTGAAIMGMRPVAEMQFADFISCAWDHLVTVAAKQRYRAGTPVPIVVRLPSGGGFSGGPFHSQNPESSFAHIAGLKVVCPATPEDAKGLLITAIEDPNPVLYFEHKHLYRRIKDEVPDDRYTVPFGEARTHREGDDISLITWAAMVYTADEAAQKLEGEGISVEILDLRTLAPWDKEAVLRSVEKTSKALVLHEDTLTGGFGAEIAATIAAEGFENLDAPVRRIAAPDTPVPFSPPLEKAFIPQVEDVVAGVKELAEY